MPAKKKSKKPKATAKKTPKRKAATSKKASRRLSSLKSRFGKTATEVLAGAAAGAVRALIPPLEEAAGATERMAQSKTKGQQKRKSAAR